MLVLAALQLAAAGTVVTRLRADALKARQVDQALLDTRYRITDSDRAAWEMLAQGSPNFTDAQQIIGDAAQMHADLRYLHHAAGGSVGVGEVLSWVGPFETDLRAVEGLVAAHRALDAQNEMLVGADSTAQLIQQTVASLAATFSARASAANERLYVGTLAALAASAVLVLLLACGFVMGRRRTAAAERSALARSERRFRALVHKASEVVLVVDQEQRITYVTDAVKAFTGRTAAEVTGTLIEDLVPDDERPRAQQFFERTLRTGGSVTPSEWTLRRNGEPILVEVESTDQREDPDVAGMVLTVRDVTGRRRVEAQLRHQALHDQLTGLPNRTLFEDRVDQALQRAARQGTTISVLYLDLDGFKAINDSFGHAAGDELLRTVAARLDESLRGADAAARLGGDEFACLVDGLDDRSDALSIARRVAASVGRPVTLEGREITVRPSIGIAHSTGAPIGAEQLIHNADLAMYESKAEGRGQLAVFEDDLLVAAKRQLHLREDLRLAIEREELAVVHQPLVSLETGEVLGTEALVRWQHAEHGFVPPDQFIPVAEETGLIVTIGRWVLNRALADLAGWSESHPDVRLNVNVAPRELAEPDYPATVADALARHGVAASRLTLEITESEIIDAEETIGRLNALADLGVNLSIDDFGTGQSSLARLQRLPVKQVKLDRSFLASIDEDNHTATLVRSMIELGQALGLQMVAEGIERDSQHTILRDAARRIDQSASDALGQGYLFARPQPADAIAALLQTAGPEPVTA